MSKLKFALIGCGRISPKHLNAIKQNKEAELVATCDLIEEKAKKAAQEFNANYYTNYNEMIKNEEIDVVSILTPNGTHAKITIDIAGKIPNILVEKPMAIKNENAEKMIKACKENNTRLFIVKQNRFNKAIQKLREAIELKKFGKIVLATARVRWTRRQDYYENSWHGTKELDGGILFNQASHHIDLLHWLIGDVESVFCKKSTMLVDIETEDTAICTIKFKNKALGIIEATTATRPHDLEGSISVLGEKGSVVVGGFAANKIVTWEFENESQEEKEKALNSCENPSDVYGFGHIKLIENIIESIKTGKKALVEGEDGAKIVRLINAMYESTETGKEIFLD